MGYQNPTHPSEPGQTPSKVSSTGLTPKCETFESAGSLESSTNKCWLFFFLFGLKISVFHLFKWVKKNLPYLVVLIVK